MYISRKEQEQRQAIKDAIEAGNLDYIKTIPRQRLSLPITKWGSSALHVAVKADDLSITRFLILNFPEMINQPDENGETPIYFAVLKGHYLIAELLLNSGACPYLKEPFNQGRAQPIHIAVIQFDVEMIQLLLSKNPELIKCKLKSGETPLQLAVQYKSIPSICLMLDCLVNITEENIEALYNSENPDDIVMAIAQLHLAALSPEDFFEALFKHPRPLHLAMGLCKLHTTGIGSPDLNQALMRSHQPLSLALSICGLKAMNCWVDQHIHALQQARSPIQYFNLTFCYSFALEYTREQYTLLCNEQAPLHAHLHPAFYQSMNQARHYHGLFSAKRNLIDHHESPAAQHEYDKQYGLTIY